MLSVIKALESSEEFTVFIQRKSAELNQYIKHEFDTFFGEFQNEMNPELSRTSSDPISTPDIKKPVQVGASKSEKSELPHKPHIEKKPSTENPKKPRKNVLLFQNQVGGHYPLIHFGERVGKPLFPKELAFYQNMPSWLKGMCPKFFGVTDLRKAKHDSKLYTLLYGPGEDISDSTPLPSSAKKIRKEDLVPPKQKQIDEKEPEESSESSRPNIPTVDIPTHHRTSVAESPARPSHRRLTSGSSFANLNPWSKKCAMKKIKKGKLKNSHLFISLEDITNDFRKPCVFDIKAGIRCWGKVAKPSKIISQKRKALQTTSYNLGLRMCGFQVYQHTTESYTYLDKYYGRKLDVKGFEDVFQKFFHNGSWFRSDVLPYYINRITEMIRLISTKGRGYRFYSSSILLVYEGLVDPEWTPYNEGDNLGENYESREYNSLSPIDECIPLHEIEQKLIAEEEQSEDGYVEIFNVENDSQEAEIEAEEEEEESSDSEEEEPTTDTRFFLENHEVFNSTWLKGGVRRPRIKLIDFQNHVIVDSNEPDHGLLFGLQSLLEMMKKMLQEHPNRRVSSNKEPEISPVDSPRMEPETPIPSKNLL